MVVSMLREPCPCAVERIVGSPFAWSISAGMGLLPGCQPGVVVPALCDRFTAWLDAALRGRAPGPLLATVTRA
jgi:hypothetical protein